MGVESTPMMEAILSPLLDAILHKLCSQIADGSRFFSGIGADVDWLRDELQIIQSILQAAEEASGSEDQSFLMLVDQIRQVVYDSEDLLEVFHVLTTHSHTLSPPACIGYNLKSRYRIGSKVKEIRSRIGDISRRRLDYQFGGGADAISTEWGGNCLHGLASSPLVHHGDIVGMENDFEQLFEWVLAGGAELSVISLVGMGGVGKTTLIKKIYGHGDVARHFDKLAWIYVSQSIQLRELFAEMVKRLMETPSTDADALSETQLQESLLRSLADKRYLIVFDDVWSRRFWDAIKLVLPSNKLGSRMIITTRNNEVPSAIIDIQSYVHQLRPLSPEESWALFCNKVFGKDGPRCPEELKEVAEAIVRKCDGLPLAVVTIGGMMLRKERTQLEWQRVLGNVYKDFSNDHVGVQRALLSSYRDLPYLLRLCFMLVSVFPNDYVISRKRLIRLWVAEGFIHEETGEVMEDVAEKYLMELISRSMVQVSLIGSSGRVKACRVHDLLHQLAISIADKERYSAVYEDQTTGVTNKALRISFHKRYCSAVNCKGKMCPRSLFTFGIEDQFRFSHQQLRNFRSLRVLDLEGAGLTKLPIEVGDLIHLRYLGLKGTKIKKLPKSLKNLYYLQTLDIRRTNMRKLSFMLKHLRQLRHLEMGQVGQSVRVEQGLGCLERLQVVTGLQANKLVIHEIRKLSQLKKLGIEDLQAEDAIRLSSSINNVGALSSLSIFSKDDANPLELSALTNTSSLQKLHIAGCLERLPDWFYRIQNLTKLRLGLSKLSEDPFIILEKLPNLLFLQLYEAYRGKVMRCSKTGFNKLKILLLTELEVLEEWNLEEGTMPCIQELWIMSCPRLKMIPSGFKFLTTMQTLRLVSMPGDFISRVSSPSGEDFCRVQHIPSIQILR